VVLRVTAHTIDLVFSPISLDCIKHRKVALCALGCCQGLYLFVVRRPFLGSRFLGYPEMRKNQTDHTKDTDYQGNSLRSHFLLTSAGVF
jgi:hypothetical protein